MEALYIVIGLVALVVVYFLFFKKPEEKALPPREAEKKAPPPREEAPAKPPAEKPEAPAERAPEQPAAEAPAGEEAAERPAEEQPPAAAGEARPALSEKTDVASLREGLAKSRQEGGFFGKLRALFAGKTEISPETAEEIEEILVASDVGMKTTQQLLDRVREVLDKSDLGDPNRVWQALRDEARRILEADGRAGAFRLRARPTVVLMVGVNGSGKTTTIGKLATKLKAEGLECVLAAGDTFRAAAVQQLMVWGKRVGCEVVRGKDGADPGSVVFDAIKKAEESGADIVLADTAGRLHTKTNLMQEMQKIARTAGKAMEGAPHETLLVIDATNGQNALAQAEQFKEALDLTGVVLTKLDGTAKGGVVLGISDTLGLPVRFIGLGERPDDLHEFSPDRFVEALLGREEANAA